MPDVEDPQPGGPTRRVLLLAGAVTVGAAALGVQVAASASSRRSGVVAASPVASGTPTPTPTLDPLPDPTPFATFPTLANPGVMQDFSYLPAISTFFVTQKSAGSEAAFETLIISRVNASGAVLDAMTLIDGGHGLGIEAESQPDATYIWVTWQGKSLESGWRENDFVRFRYTPGSWSRADAVGQLGLVVLPLKDEPEAQFRFDWKNDWAVERHYDWNGATETYKRRRISDISNGVMLPDEQLDRLPLPVDPPTTQGFATIDDTFYRWLGRGTVGDAIEPTDPITLQRFDWKTGRLLAEQHFSTVSKVGTSWPGGKFEPEGMCMFREPDGAATLLVGDTTGLPKHEHHVSAFARITI